MSRPDFEPGIHRYAREPRPTPLYAGTVAVVVVSGFCALVALAAGSPLQFGVALAIFGAGWIAADFIECTVETGQERLAGRGAVVPRPVPAYRPSRVVYAGRCEHFMRPGLRAVSRLAV